jgi:hypothetical protein
VQQPNGSRSPTSEPSGQRPPQAIPNFGQAAAENQRSGINARGPKDLGTRQPTSISSRPAERALTEHRLALSPTASLVAKPNHSGFTATKAISTGDSIVVDQHVGVGGQTQIIAYRKSVSANGGATTRVYTDGRESVETAKFHSSGQINGPQFVHYRSGLRAAYGPGGRPLYADTFVKRPPTGGSARPQSWVQRTIYATTVDGAVQQLPMPIRRYYTLNRVAGYDTFVYQSQPYPPLVYAFLYAPLAFPIAVGPRCSICPSAGVLFAAPPSQYSDPVEILGDMQIAGAVTDQGVVPVAEATAEAEPPPPPAASDDIPPPPPPTAPAELQAATAQGDSTNLQTLKTQADELQSQAAERAKRDAPPPSSQDAEKSALVQTSAPVNVDALESTDLLPVPEAVRAQIHKQVRLSLAEQAHEHPLTLIDIMQSGYSRIYLFQVAAAIDTASVVSGDGCALGSGDLLAFTSLTDAQQRPSAQMKVVTARAGHCLSQDTVEISVGDLQEMLNTFNQRMEENIRKLHACAATKNGCVNT